MSETVISPEVIREAILELNTWHPNVPLILVFSSQKKEPDELVEGGNQAVRHAYDSLFALEKIGIADDARKYYLHFCHQARDPEQPYAIRKPTANYGKTHQRIIKDTFGQQFLDRETSGRYRLREDFATLVKSYFETEREIDLYPIVLFSYWNNIDEAQTVGDLWERFADEFGVRRPPYDSVFSCRNLSSELATVPRADFSLSQIKQFALPNEYGVGAFNADFWKHFRIRLEDHLRRLKWQGDTYELSSNIAAGLMYDQSVFLLGDPGTGKTTIVLEAVLPALRESVGTLNEVRLAYHSLTPMTTAADLFGFQGLDGRWIEGPLVKELLSPYAVDTQTEEAEALGGDELGEEVDVAEDSSSDGDLGIPRLLFLDEANRVDVEGLLSPLQAAFDRLQKRMEPPTVVLGQSEYAAPRRIWRVFAGNSPIADRERREQARPFKRRCSMIVPPDPMEAVLGREDSFRRFALDLLGKATESDDAELSEPAIVLAGRYSENPGRLEQFRQLLSAVFDLKRVPVTVGLTESILLRAAAQNVLRPEGSLDSSVCSSLGSQVAGERTGLEGLSSVADAQNFPHFARLIRELLHQQGELAMELDPIL